MSQFLKQGVVTVITFGPFLAKGDGVTLQTGVGIIASIDNGTTGILLSKNGGGATIREQGANFVASTYDAHGFFKVSLSAVDTGTLGTLMVMHSEPATYLSVWRVFMVVPAQVWNSLFGADKLDVAVVEQADIDFMALQKVSLNAATPASIQNIPATGSGFTALGDTRLAKLDAAVSDCGLEATLTAIKGVGWSGETLVALKAYVDELESRLTATRAGYLDNLSAGAAALEATLTAIKGASWSTETLKAIKDAQALEASLTAIKGSGWSTETLKAIKEYVDDLESRLTADRAGYLDELGSLNIPADVDTLLTRLTALRAGYLDNLSAGAVALEGNVASHAEAGAGAALTTYGPAKPGAVMGKSPATLAAADVSGFLPAVLTDKAGFTISGTKQTLDALHDATQGATKGELDAAQAAIIAVLPDISDLALEGNVATHAEAGAGAALVSYDPPTQTELEAAIAGIPTTDLSGVLAAINALNDLSLAEILGADLGDGAALTLNSLGDLIRKLAWLAMNKLVVLNADGTWTLYQGDGATPAATGQYRRLATTTERSAPTWPEII